LAFSVLAQTQLNRADTQPRTISDTADRELHAQAQALFGALEPPNDVDTQQAALGRALFFDTRIAPDGKTGCVSCHWPDRWGADPRPHSPDARGKLTERHSQTIFNATAQSALRWRADRRSAAHQAEDSLTGSMGFAHTGDVVPVLKSRGYEAAFKRAFPQDDAPVSPANWGRALEAYQRTLVTPAPFDAYLRGDDAALTPRQKAGLSTFIANGCAGCHNGPLLGGRSNQKFGMVSNYWLATGSKVIDVGRQAITRDESDRYVFRVSMLRNVARTAPYFHDGSVPELRDAVRIMASVQLGRELSDADTAAIVTFLEALTGPVPTHFAPP
jgi:cytochrome c peroxidase